jgi:transcription initiation factor IIE alpha subunit
MKGVKLQMAKSKNKKKDKIRARIKAQKAKIKKEQEGILYICTECGEKEYIPEDVVDYFDIMDDGNISEPPTFSCQKCESIMRPKHYRGVHGIEYTL